MCSQCKGEKVIWVCINGIIQCQPCLKCNLTKDKSIFDILKEQSESKLRREKNR